MTYTPTLEDQTGARDVLDSDMGLDGQYRGRGGREPPVQLRVEWLSAGDALDGGTGAAPWEPTPVAFVAVEDVPQPREGDMVRPLQDGIQWHRVRSFTPEGGFWRLNLVEQE